MSKALKDFIRDVDAVFAHNDKYPGSIPVPNKESDMNVTNFSAPLTSEQVARNHLNNRAYDAKSEKRDELRQHFAIDDLPPPKTIKELKERLSKGEYRISPDMKDEAHILWMPMDELIRWRTKDADEKGYKKSYDALTKSFLDTRDIIMVKSPDEGLKAFQEFEKATFH